MVLVSIDGEPVSKRLAEARNAVSGSSSERATRLRLYRRLLEGEPDTTVTLELANAQGTKREVTLTRRVVSDLPLVNSRRLASGYGYIRVTQWRSPIHKTFKRALDQFRDAPGLILDLRGNPGGEVSEVLKIAGYFFNEKVPFGRFLTRGGRSLELYSERDSRPYRGAVAILMNESSGSGSEMFAGVFQENRRATVLGHTSCGCLLGIAKFKKLEGGSELAVSELGYLSPRGKRLEGVGVVPDDTVALTLVDIRKRRDATLEAAEHALEHTATR
jgi:carboxyl-terminal processing protease